MVWRMRILEEEVDNKAEIEEKKTGLCWYLLLTHELNVLNEAEIVSVWIDVVIVFSVERESTVF